MLSLSHEAAIGLLVAKIVTKQSIRVLVSTTCFA